MLHGSLNPAGYPRALDKEKRGRVDAALAFLRLNGTSLAAAVPEAPRAVEKVERAAVVDGGPVAGAYGEARRFSNTILVYELGWAYSTTVKTLAATLLHEGFHLEANVVANFIGNLRGLAGRGDLGWVKVWALRHHLGFDSSDSSEYVYWAHAAIQGGKPGPPPPSPRPAP